MLYTRRKSNINFASEAKTSGEEFRNRSKGAKLGWLKRLGQAGLKTGEVAGKTLSNAAIILTRPDLISSRKIADLKRRAKEDATFLTDEALTAGTLGLLLLTKRGRAITKGTFKRVAKGTKGFVKEGFGDVPGKVYKNLRKKSKAVDDIGTVVEDIVSPTGKKVGTALGKGYKGAKTTVEVVRNIPEKTIQVGRTARKEADYLGMAAQSPVIRQTRKEIGKKALDELDQNKPTGFLRRLAWQGKRDRAQIKTWTGFNRYSNNFWVEFNSRKTENIEFAKKRKPMSEETKRKISRSVARSKGSTAGYDTDKVNEPRGYSLDRGIESLGKLTKAVNPILRYMNERENISERKKRRQIQTLNTTIYGLGTGSRILSTANSGRLARQRLASRENLLDKTLRSREGIERIKAENRIQVENIKQPARMMTARAYSKQPRMTAANIISNPKKVNNLTPAERQALRDVVLGK